jgi:hypothetical protein
MTSISQRVFLIASILDGYGRHNKKLDSREAFCFARFLFQTAGDVRQLELEAKRRANRNSRKRRISRRKRS